MTNYTAIVIGSGPAGHTCAVRMAQLGGRVAVVERDYVGGICTNWGCTPSKSMIESAKVARTVRESRKYGIEVPNWSIRFEQVADIIHAHPTYSEITRSVLHYALGKAADSYLEG